MERNSVDFSFRAFFALALPFALQNLMTSCLNMVDTVMVGGLGATAISAVAIPNNYFTLFNLILYGIGSGMSVMIAQYAGSGDDGSANRILGIGLLFSLGLSAVFIFPAAVFPECLLRIFTSDAELVSLGADYLFTVIFSYAMTAVTACYLVMLRNKRMAKTVLLISVSAVLANTILNYLFIYGKLGLPAMGVHGAALATLISRAYEVVFVLIYVSARKLCPVFDIKELFVRCAEHMRVYVKVTLPVVANQLFWTLSITARVFVFARMGVGALAAMNVANTVDHIVSSGFYGAVNALEITIGNQIGAEKKDMAQRTALLFLKRTPVIGLLFTAALLSAARPIPALFTFSAEEAQFLSGMIGIIAIAMPLRLTLGFLSGIMRSGGKTALVTVIDSGFAWGIGVSLCYVFGITLQLSPVVAYIGVVAEYIPRFVFQLMLFVSRKWIRDVVKETKA
ncbi:MAG: MATE family efflux transporter [Clostridiales Family XIII bacterium]|jgi:putative MATE family efflux protein|nr:MATE family efflux transporter [Clostridiales Family XIII bacterium]